MSATGKDQNCLMLKNLSESSDDLLFEFCYKVWEGWKFPKSWKDAVIIPVSKLGKDSTKPGNYRPIALTSHVCKIMDKNDKSKINLLHGI